MTFLPVPLFVGAYFMMLAFAVAFIVWAFNLLAFVMSARRSMWTCWVSKSYATHSLAHPAGWAYTTTTSEARTDTTGASCASLAMQCWRSGGNGDDRPGQQAQVITRRKNNLWDDWNPSSTVLGDACLVQSLMSSIDQEERRSGRLQV